MDHPLGQVLAGAGAPGDADRDAGGAPVVPNARRRAEQHAAVRRVGDGAVHHPLHPLVGQDRHPLQGGLQPGHDAVVVGLEELVLRLPGRAVEPDRARVLLLVDADQAGLLLLADVARDQVVVAHHGQLGLALDELGHRVGHQVVVGRRDHRQVEPDPRADLARVGAGRVDHHLRAPLALLGDHPPAALLVGLDVGYPVLADHLGAHLPRTLGEGEGGARRIDVAVGRGVERGLDAVEIVEGVELGDLGRREDLHGVAQGGADAHDLAEVVHLAVGVGHAQRAAAVEGDRLAGLRLDRLVELDAVAGHLGDRVVAERVGDLPGGVPGRARGQLGLLQQHAVAPAFLGQVVEQAGAHDTAADDDDPGVIDLHGFRPFLFDDPAKNFWCNFSGKIVP